MGLISVLSDLGSIGSTTKWAINLYQDLKSKNKNITDSEIFQMMMIIRYNKIKLPSEEPLGIYDSKKFLIYRAQIAEYHAGLTGIIIDILHIEAGLWKNELENMLKMLPPLEKRMSEANFSEKTKYGPLEKFEISKLSIGKHSAGKSGKWNFYLVRLLERIEVCNKIEEQNPGILEGMFQASLQMFEKNNK
ncbi:hypothetical protein OAM28_01085 [Candidatus Pelagibacter sp.]|jgi:hypothetical protein|nr:hypothetical protein [Candidatus Pelagibacter sp.]MDC0404684.1 hypothetical protein [Candidatus Pelagibacter sp.]|tara:strand:- start:13 stop:585 length:573 start_codon:yes stop_codon:yes gene_type:complete